MRQCHIVNTSKTDCATQCNTAKDLRNADNYRGCSRYTASQIYLLTQQKVSALTSTTAVYAPSMSMVASFDRLKGHSRISKSTQAPSCLVFRKSIPSVIWNRAKYHDKPIHVHINLNIATKYASKLLPLKYI
jgi:hypothetical protein